MDIYEQLSAFRREGIPCMMVTVIAKTGEGPLNVGKKMLVTETDKAFGTVGGGAIEYEARERCRRLLREGSNDLATFVLEEGRVVEDATTLPMACGGTATLFFEYIGADAYVYIFGAGHVGQALSKVLKTMNYFVTVIDHRQEVIDTFQGADRKYCKSFIDFIDEEGIQEGSYVVVCTPSHQYDYNVMDRVFELKLNPRYIGMLCSRQKLKDYLGRTYEKFGQDVDLTNFYSPIGIDTGGGSPAEIALSIAAEILAIRHGKANHNHMRGPY